MGDMTDTQTAPLTNYLVTWTESVDAPDPDTAAEAALAALQSQRMTFVAVQTTGLAPAAADSPTNSDLSWGSLDDDDDDETAAPVADLGPPEMVMVERESSDPLTIAQELDILNKDFHVYADVLAELDNGEAVDVWTAVTRLSEHVAALLSDVETHLKGRLDAGEVLPYLPGTRVAVEPTQRWANPVAGPVDQTIIAAALGPDSDGAVLDKGAAVLAAMQMMRDAYLSPSSTPKTGWLVAHDIDPNRVMDMVASGRGWKLVPVADPAD